MLIVLEKILSTLQVESPDGSLCALHSHTSADQGLFLQKMFNIARPRNSLEIGMAYGISSLFILEKHQLQNSNDGAHLIIEPFPWGGVAEHNFNKAGVMRFADIHYKRSFEVLPELLAEGKRIQFAYVDTIKHFDNAMLDIFFIDKILDINGLIILDDCGGSWPGIQKAVRFLNTLPHYKFEAGHQKSPLTLKRKLAETVTSFLLSLVPFKRKFLPGYSLKTDLELGLEYRCIAFRKIGEDSREWTWDEPI